MEHDIFFSYPHKDAKEVEHILKALQAEGLNVWIDKSEINDYAGITRSIVDGLAHSKVLLAYYSLNYWRSRACQWELTAGFLAAQREGDPRKRMLVINPDEKAEHIHPVELRDELFQKAPKDAEALKKLVQSVKNHVSGIKSAIGDIHALTQPSWYPGTAAGSNRFVGRLPDMWRIHSALHASGVPIITGAVASAIVQLQGMGGVGKSLLAEEYALRYAAAFPGGVFWLRALGNDDAKTSMGEEREAERIRQISDFAIKCGIAVEKKSPEEIEAALARELAGRGKPYLWVVDDVPSGMEMENLKKWLAPHPLGRMLITTRTNEYSSLGTLIPLGVLEPEEAYELLTSWRKPAGKEEDDAARMLLEDLGRHSLAVEVAGAALKASEGLQSFAEYREELASPTEDELELAAEFAGTLPTGHEKSIAGTLLRSIRQLGQEGWDFLRLASVLAVAPIPALLVSSVFSEVDGLDEAEGKKKAKLALFQAEKLSLAERSEDETGARTVHTLISRTVRFRDPQPGRIDMIKAASVSALIHKLSVINDDSTHRELKLEVAHARQLVNRGDDIQTAKLIGWVARYDSLQGAHKSAETLRRHQCDIQNRLLGEEHPNTLITITHLAETLRSQGNLPGARKIQEQVLQIRRRVLGEEHPDTLITINNLAETLRSQGNLPGARIFQEQVLQIQRRVLGDEHSDTITTMNNLAETLRSQGNLSGARKIQEHVLEISRKIWGEEHPFTLKSMNNLALTLCAQCDLSGARKIQEHVLEISRKISGEEHPDTLTDMNNLAATIYAQGDMEGAREKHEKVLEIRRRILGEEHPDTFRSMNNLAATIYAQGDIEGARKIFEKVFETFRKIKGEEHPDTLISMNNLAAIIYAQGDMEGTRKIIEQVLETIRKIKGEEHPETLTYMKNLAVILEAQGDLSNLRKIQEKVLEISRRILGKEHPDTSLSASNLVATLFNIGDSAEAGEILQENLLWLLDRDPASLEANQQKIREMIIQMIGGRD